MPAMEVTVMRKRIENLKVMDEIVYSDGFITRSRVAAEAISILPTDELKGLQRLSATTFQVTTVLNHCKRKAARRPHQRPAWVALVERIEGLRKDRDAMQLPTREARHEAYLDLTRHFINQATATVMVKGG
jgi:hypothetical protein